MLPITEAADDVLPAVLCLVMCVRADTADPNVLLRLTEYLALLCIAAMLVLRTGSHPIAREHLACVLNHV